MTGDPQMTGDPYKWAHAPCRSPSGRR
jgi:hypothetical protein